MFERIMIVIVVLRVVGKEAKLDVKTEKGCDGDWLRSVAALIAANEGTGGRIAATPSVTRPSVSARRK